MGPTRPFPVPVTYTKPTGLARVNECESFAQGLLGAWLFESGSGKLLLDSGPYGHHGTLGAGVSWSSSFLGGGIQFADSATSLIDIPYNTRFNCPNGLAISVRGVLPSSFVSTDFRSLFGKPFSVPFSSPYWDYDCGLPYVSSTQLKVEFRVGSVTIDSGGAGLFLAPGQKFHVIVSQNRAGDMELWVDGVQYATSAGQARPTNTNSLGPRFGYLEADVNNFDGVIESAFFWERGLLTSEIRDLFAQPYAPIVGAPDIDRTYSFFVPPQPAALTWLPSYPDYFRSKVGERPSGSQAPIGDVTPVADVSWVQRQDNPRKLTRRIVHGEIAGPAATPDTTGVLGWIPSDGQILRPYRRSDSSAVVQPVSELDTPSRLTWLPTDQEARKARRPIDYSVSVEPSLGDLSSPSRLTWLPTDQEARRARRPIDYSVSVEPSPGELDSASRLLWLPGDQEARRWARRAELSLLVEPLAELDSTTRLMWLPEIQEARRALRRINYGQELASPPAGELDVASRLTWLPIDVEARRWKRHAELSAFVEPIAELDAASRLTWLPVCLEIRIPKRRETFGGMVAPAVVVAEPGIPWFPWAPDWFRPRRLPENGQAFAPTPSAIGVTALPWLQILEPLPVPFTRRLNPSLMVGPTPAEVFAGNPWARLTEQPGRARRSVDLIALAGPLPETLTGLPWLPVLPEAGRRARAPGEAFAGVFPVDGGLGWLPSYPDAMVRRARGGAEAFAMGASLALAGMPWAPSYPELLRRARQGVSDAAIGPLGVDPGLAWLPGYPDALTRRRALEGGASYPVLQVDTSLAWLPSYPDRIRPVARVSQLGVPVGWVEPPAQLPAGLTLYWLPQYPSFFFRQHPVAGLPVGFLLTPESIFVIGRKNTSTSVVGANAAAAGVSGLSDGKKTGLV